MTSGSASNTLPWGSNSSEDDATPMSALLRDKATVLRHLGVQALRTSIVDIPSMAFQATWSINDDGEFEDSPVERALESVFPGGSATIDLLGWASADETFAQKLSPRRWVFAWRLDESNAVITEAQFHARRDAVSELDKLLMRLVCNSGVPAETAASPAGRALAANGLSWPKHERRARPPRSLTGYLAVMLLLIASAVASGWFAWVAVPEARDAANALQAEIEQSARMADGSMMRVLSHSLATDDYGDVQGELSMFSSLGYFQGAVITNTKDRIVALSGTIERLRIGDVALPDHLPRTRAIDLTIGSEHLGRLLFVPRAPPARSVAQTGGGLMFAALMAFGMSIVALGLFATQWRRAAS